MPKLHFPDLCAHLDRLKRLCDRLEKAQTDQQRYGKLEVQIRAEMDALHTTICSYHPPVAARARVGI